MEQLVHLRLKSIYKAFKQSGAAITNGTGKDGDASRGETTNTLSTSPRMYFQSTYRALLLALLRFASLVASLQAAAAAALARAAGLPGESLDAALDDFDPRSESDMTLAGDVGAVLQAAAQAAANNKQDLWKGVDQKKEKKHTKSRTEEEVRPCFIFRDLRIAIITN